MLELRNVGLAIPETGRGSGVEFRGERVDFHKGAVEIMVVPGTLAIPFTNGRRNYEHKLPGKRNGANRRSQERG